MDDDVLPIPSDDDDDLLATIAQENLDLLPESPDVPDLDEIDLLPRTAALENLDDGDLPMVEDGDDGDRNDENTLFGIPLFGEGQLAGDMDGAPPIGLPVGPPELDAAGTAAPALQAAQATRAPRVAGGGSGPCPRCDRMCSGTGARDNKKRCQRLCCAAAIVLYHYRADPDVSSRRELVRPSKQWRRAVEMQKAPDKAQRDQLAQEVKEMAACGAPWKWDKERAKSSSTPGKAWERFRESWLLDDGAKAKGTSGVRWAEAGEKNEKRMTFIGTYDDRAKDSWRWAPLVECPRRDGCFRKDTKNREGPKIYVCICPRFWRPCPEVAKGDLPDTVIPLDRVMREMFDRLQGAGYSFRADIDEITRQFERGEHDAEVYCPLTTASAPEPQLEPDWSQTQQLTTSVTTAIGILVPEETPALEPMALGGDTPARPKRSVDADVSPRVTISQKKRRVQAEELLESCSLEEVRMLLGHLDDDVTPRYRGGGSSLPRSHRVTRILELMSDDAESRQCVEELLRKSRGGDNAEETKQRAFVVGINNYAKDKLKNAVADAERIGACLESDLGFQVTKLTDDTAPGHRVVFSSFRESFTEFLKTITPGDVVAIAFMGHGIEENGKNYLLPHEQEDEFLSTRAMDVQNMLDEIYSKKPRATLFFLDCCREKPTRTRSTRGVSQGLAAMDIDPARGVMIMFACAAGGLSSDGDGDGGSPFTRTLVRHLKRADMPLERLPIYVRADMAKITTPPQVPWLSWSMSEFWYLKGRRGLVAQVPTKIEPKVAPPELDPAEPGPEPEPEPELEPEPEPDPEPEPELGVVRGMTERQFIGLDYYLFVHVWLRHRRQEYQRRKSKVCSCLGCGIYRDDNDTTYLTKERREFGKVMMQAGQNAFREARSGRTVLSGRVESEALELVDRRVTAGESPDDYDLWLQETFQLYRALSKTQACEASMSSAVWTQGAFQYFLQDCYGASLESSLAWLKRDVMIKLKELKLDMLDTLHSASTELGSRNSLRWKAALSEAVWMRSGFPLTRTQREKTSPSLYVQKAVSHTRSHTSWLDGATRAIKASTGGDKGGDSPEEPSRLHSAKEKIEWECNPMTASSSHVGQSLSYALLDRLQHAEKSVKLKTLWLIEGIIGDIPTSDAEITTRIPPSTDVQLGVVLHSVLDPCYDDTLVACEGDIVEILPPELRPAMSVPSDVSNLITADAAKLHVAAVAAKVRLDKRGVRKLAALIGDAYAPRRQWCRMLQPAHSDSPIEGTTGWLMPEFFRHMNSGVCLVGDQTMAVFPVGDQAMAVQKSTERLATAAYMERYHNLKISEDAMEEFRRVVRDTCAAELYGLRHVGLNADGSTVDSPTTDEYQKQRLEALMGSEGPFSVEFARSFGAVPDNKIRASASRVLKALHVASAFRGQIRYSGLYKLTGDYNNPNGHPGVLVAKQGDACEVLKDAGEWTKVCFVIPGPGSPVSRRETGYVPTGYLAKMQPEPQQPQPQPQLQLELAPVREPQQSEPILTLSAGVAAPPKEMQREPNTDMGELTRESTRTHFMINFLRGQVGLSPSVSEGYVPRLVEEGFDTEEAFNTLSPKELRDDFEWKKGHVKMFELWKEYKGGERP